MLFSRRMVGKSVLSLSGIALSLFGAMSASTTAQVSQAQKKKPTEFVVARYERLVLIGDLLTPAGWKRASNLFVLSDPYSQTGDIHVMWTGGVIGEDWVRGDRAQVETKWNNWYGTIDSTLRFKPDALGTLPMIETFSLVFIQPQSSAAGQWKIEGPLHARSADIPQSISYVKKMRDLSADPVIRRNADKTIEALRRLATSGCGSASAC